MRLGLDKVFGHELMETTTVQKSVIPIRLGLNQTLLG